MLGAVRQDGFSESERLIVCSVSSEATAVVPVTARTEGALGDLVKMVFTDPS